MVQSEVEAWWVLVGKRREDGVEVREIERLRGWRIVEILKRGGERRKRGKELLSGEWEGNTDGGKVRACGKYHEGHRVNEGGAGHPTALHRSFIHDY